MNMRFRISDCGLRIDPLGGDGAVRQNQITVGDDRESFVSGQGSFVPGQGSFVPGRFPERKQQFRMPLNSQKSSRFSASMRGSSHSQRSGACRQSSFRTPHSALRTSRGFSLVEILLVVSLLSLIVLALMAVFSSTQRAFRASVTQADVLESGRMVTDMIATDLRGLTPSYGISNSLTGVPTPPAPPINLMIVGNVSSPNTYLASYYYPLQQTLTGSSADRTNLLNYFFVLGRENTKWTGTGYIVDSSSSRYLYPLYRFYAETNTLYDPRTLFDRFNNYVYNGQWTNLSHLVDGVVHLTVRAYDSEGRWIDGSSAYPYLYTNAANTYFLLQSYGESQFYMFSNTVPAAVELELGILEDRALARAESRGVAGQPPMTVLAQSNYLAGQSGALHVFHRRVTIPNVDTSAYK
jgi:type II secretory pathway pseudopilin PulG